VFHAADPQLSSGGRAELGEIGTRREHFGAAQLSETKRNVIAIDGIIMLRRQRAGNLVCRRFITIGRCR